MSSTPIFTATPKIGMAQVSAANTNRDGTGTIVDIYTAGASGSRIEHIDIVAAGTVTAGVVRLYVYDGTNSRLWKEILVTATTPSTTIQVFNSSIPCSALSNLLVLQSGYKLRASTNNAETFNIIAVGGDY